MWVHILIFCLIPVSALAFRRGWIVGEGRFGKKDCLLYLGVALIGNLLGMWLTIRDGGEEIYPDGVRLEKEDAGAREEKFYVTVAEGEADPVYVQIPQKAGAEKDPEEEKEDVSQEETQKELLAVIEEYNQEKDDPDYYYLPAELDGKKLQWIRSGDTSGTFLAGLCFAAAVLLLGEQSRMEQQKLRKRREQLLMDYPALVMKFTLLVQAGMTVRRAFQKIGEDYLRRKPARPRFAYEEIVTACREMESGVSELEAYRRFGERCNQIQYKTFSTLLIQNLQKGSRQLSDMLERESLEAWEERKRKARVLGETAATKLLFPMILMMMVVMALIMIPAFLSFYGGA